MLLGREGIEEMIRLLKYVALLACAALFYTAFLDFELFAGDKSKTQGSQVEIGVSAPKVTIEQAEWIAKTSTVVFRSAYYGKVDRIARVKDMSFDYAIENDIECTVSDPFGTIDIVCFDESNEEIRSTKFPLATTLEQWFNKNGVDGLYEKHDKEDGVYRAAVSLVANANCQVCHNYTRDSLIAALLVEVPLKDEIVDK